MLNPTSEHIREQIAEYESARANALRELDDLAARRRDLLLNPADKAGDKALFEHDAAVQLASRAVERADAHLAWLRAELPHAEEREEQQRQQAVHADLLRMGGRYREIVQHLYPAAAEPLIELLVELEVLEREIAAHNKSVPGSLRVSANDFRCDARGGRYFGPLHETVSLPAVMQTEVALWPLPAPPVQQRVETERPPVRINEFGKEILFSDGRKKDPGFTVQRVPLGQWMAERDARLKAEESAKAKSEP